MSPIIQAQIHGNIDGMVFDEYEKPVPGAFVTTDKNNVTAITSDSGYFKIVVPEEIDFNITIKLLGYQSQTIPVKVKKNETRHFRVHLEMHVKNIDEVSITNNIERASGISRISIKDFNHIPNPSGNFESLIKSMPGVSSSNELSSQYSVRGGSYDENLVYVNDVEIYRPFLIQSGQQEGLSFINPEMVSSVKFSAGGFESRYGDKMSSVLDVMYRKPIDSRYQATINLLGFSATGEGLSRNKKISWIGGARYKTSQYLLSSLDTKGNYNPSFLDFQAAVNYNVNSTLEVNFLGNYAQNDYTFVPSTRTTNFGTFDKVYNLTIYFDGKEADKYTSSTGALSVIYKPLTSLSLKFVTSAYAASEHETYDIWGEYYIGELTDNGVVSQDSVSNGGVGIMLNHARNKLYSNTYTVSHIGTYTSENHVIRWSSEYKKERIDDNLDEWTFIDSAGYFTPYNPLSITPGDFAYSKHNLNTSRLLGYIQDAIEIDGKSSKLFLTGGIRYNYWSFTKEWLISPRFRIGIKPNWKHDMMFFLAGGIYSQPPFYKEMRNIHGVVNPDIKAQRSVHFVMGSDYNLTLWNRPFKLTSEIYYKYLTNLIPYTLENIQVKYTAKNNAHGYATGIDLKLNGEFVPGIESWASLSLLQTREKRDETYLDSHGNVIQPGYYSRPTDQLVNFNLFFQDYLPNNPTFQAYMNLSFGSGLQSTPPKSVRYDQTFSMGPYRRVDLGLSKILKNEKVRNESLLFHNLKECVVSLEVFNLLDINNKASYLWIRTVQNKDNLPGAFAVPNYLTSRRVNLKLTVRF